MYEHPYCLSALCSVDMKCMQIGIVLSEREWDGFWCKSNEKLNLPPPLRSPGARVLSRLRSDSTSIVQAFSHHSSGVTLENYHFMHQIFENGRKREGRAEITCCLLFPCS